VFKLLKASSFKGVKDFFQSFQYFEKMFIDTLEALEEIFDTIET